jgi:hypothetical protein
VVSVAIRWVGKEKPGRRGKREQRVAWGPGWLVKNITRKAFRARRARGFSR